MADKPKEQPKLSSEEARQLLLAEQTQKQQKCLQEIQQVLDKYGMQISAVAVVPATQVSVIPAPQQNARRETG